MFFTSVQDLWAYLNLNRVYPKKVFVIVIEYYAYISSINFNKTFNLLTKLMGLSWTRHDILYKLGKG